MTAAVSQPAPAPRRRWALRHGDIADLSPVESMWLEEFSTSRYANIFPNREEYERVHRPRVHALLGRPDTVLVMAVDPISPDVFWGFACFTGEHTYHMALVKRPYRKAGFGEQIMIDMMGDRLKRHQWLTHDLVSLRRAKLLRYDDASGRDLLSDGTELPWQYDPYAWWST